MKLDFLDQASGKWVPAIAAKIVRSSLKDMQIVLQVEGALKEGPTINFPSPGKIDFCGKRIPEANCKKDDLKVEAKKPWKAKFCFTGLDHCPEDYEVDRGGVFSKKSKSDLEYGWGRDVSDNAR